MKRNQVFLVFISRVNSSPSKVLKKLKIVFDVLCGMSTNNTIPVEIHEVNQSPSRNDRPCSFQAPQEPCSGWLYSQN